MNLSILLNYYSLDWYVSKKKLANNIASALFASFFLDNSEDIYGKISIALVLLASFSEFFGGIMIMLGIYTRYFSILLFSTMFIATCSHLSAGDGIMGASHAIECTIIFLFLILSGSGKYGLKKD